AGEQTEAALAELATERGILEREMRRHHADLKKVAARPGEHAGARLADLQERISSTERRLADVAKEEEALDRDPIYAGEAARALAAFDPVWEALTPKEQARVLHLLVQRVVYDGAAGTVAITFQPGGIKSLAGRRNLIEGAAA